MILDAFHRLGDRLHGFWQHLPLKGLGVLSAALPMAAVVVSAALAFVGNQNRQRTETAITRHFETIVRLDALLTLLLNAETGLRGHLLTQRAEFLEPFDVARRELPDELRNLRNFIAAEPGAGPRAQKLAHLEKIETTVGQEMDLLVGLRDQRIDLSGNARDELSEQFVRSKDLMDHLRSELSEMESEEKRLLGERLADIQRVRRRDYLSVSVALFLGLLTRAVVFWLFNRRVVRRVEHLTDNVRQLAADGPLPYPPAGHHDAIGELEREIENTHARLHETAARQKSTAAQSL